MQNSVGYNYCLSRYILSKSVAYDTLYMYMYNHREFKYLASCALCTCTSEAYERWSYGVCNSHAYLGAIQIRIYYWANLKLVVQPSIIVLLDSDLRHFYTQCTHHRGMAKLLEQVQTNDSASGLSKTRGKYDTGTSEAPPFAKWRLHLPQVWWQFQNETT